MKILLIILSTLFLFSCGLSNETISKILSSQNLSNIIITYNSQKGGYVSFQATNQKDKYVFGTIEEGHDLQNKYVWTVFVSDHGSESIKYLYREQK